MTQTADLIHKMAEFFKSEEFYEKGEDARLELSPDDVRCMNAVIKACGNAVSRQSVEEMIKAEMPERGMWEIEGDKEKEIVCEVCVDLMQKLSELQPVTPKPKSGWWILNGGYWRCSKCKEKALLKFDKSKGNCREYMPVKSNFCPNCGKNMLGIQTSSERNDKK